MRYGLRYFLDVSRELKLLNKCISTSKFKNKKEKICLTFYILEKCLMHVNKLIS